ncbi:multidrug efflux MFS transporter [Bifidobacterium sp. BRDM6]|uniref:Multidrug efflux MFS transporter n=2 Tax=Bifidobacterium choloepi TaxID=2614131 RepID=A0A6I5N9H5_9BIFI|nr:multidrug efflux MFS transporter [Bifidobacterium choloepi]
MLIMTLMFTAAANGFASVQMSVALPRISDTYHITVADANWVNIAYAIVAATAIMTSARIMQRIGLKRLYFWSCLLFVISSVVGLLAVNFPLMLAARIIQAMAAGVMFPTINTVIVQVVPPAKSGSIMSINSAVIGLGAAFSPLLCGLLITYVNLTSMFAIPLVIGVVTLILGHKYVFDVEPRMHKQINVVSIILAFVGLGCLMYGFNELTDKPKIAIPLLVVGIGVLVAFVIRQFRLATPLLNLRPLRHLSVSIGVLIYMTGAMGEQAMLLLTPLYLERACDKTAFVSGLCLLIVAICYSGFIVLTGRIVDRRGMWPEVSFGFLIMSAGLFALILMAQHKSVIPAVICGAVAVIGDAFINVPTKDVVLESLPTRMVPHLNSVFSTSTQIASSMASALFIGLLSATVTRETASGVARSTAYVHGFSDAVWVALAIEIVMLIVSIWYSRQMVKHGENRVGEKKIC